jgi:hypothetical protein
MTSDNHRSDAPDRGNMTFRKSREIVMTAVDQRHHGPACRDTGVASDRAAMLAALSDELTQRFARHPLLPRQHAIERKPARWRTLSLMG